MNIVFEHDGKKYTLEYTLKTAAMAERAGLRVQEIDQKLGEQVPILVNGAFQAHHRGMTLKQTNAIYADIKKKNDFISALLEMYMDAVSALVDMDEEDEGNANWTVT